MCSSPHHVSPSVCHFCSSLFPLQHHSVSLSFPQTAILPLSRDQTIISLSLPEMGETCWELMFPPAVAVSDAVWHVLCWSVKGFVRVHAFVYYGFNTPVMSLQPLTIRKTLLIPEGKFFCYSSSRLGLGIFWIWTILISIPILHFDFGSHRVANQCEGSLTQV